MTAAVALRQDRDFRQYVLARVFSQVGISVSYVAMPTLAYALTHSSMWTALVVVGEGAPYLCFGLIAGAWGDRYDRRLIMVIADLASAALVASVPIAAAMDQLTPVHLLLAGFGTQTLQVFFQAANFGALPALVGSDRLATAQSAVFGSSHVVEIAGPAVVGFVLTIVAPAPLLTATALTFAASAVLVRSIARPLRSSAVSESRIREGLIFLYHERIVRTQTLVNTALTFSAAIFIGQLIPWADRILHVSPGDPRFGALFAAWGVGGIAASALFPGLARRFGHPRVTVLFLPVTAIAAFATALTSDWRFALAAMLIWATAFIIIVLNSLTMRQKATPDHLQSRVNTASRMISWGIGWPAGAFAGGLVSTSYSPREAILTGALVLALTAAASWRSPLAQPAYPQGHS